MHHTQDGAKTRLGQANIAVWGGKRDVCLSRKPGRSARELNHNRRQHSTDDVFEVQDRHVKRRPCLTARGAALSYADIWKGKGSEQQ